MELNTAVTLGLLMFGVFSLIVVRCRLSLMLSAEISNQVFIESGLVVSGSDGTQLCSEPRKVAPIAFTPGTGRRKATAGPQSKAFESRRMILRVKMLVPGSVRSG